MENESSTLGTVTGVISIVLGVAGIATGVYVFGGPIGIVGVIFSLISALHVENRIIPMIGIILSLAAVGWFMTLCVLLKINI